MLLGLVRAMLGPFAGVLDWAQAHPEPITLAIFAWAMLWFLGQLQLKHIQSETTRLVIRLGRSMLRESPGLSTRKLYELIYPIWAASLPHWALFIPHRTEMWPVPIRPEIVERRIGFSPDWIQSALEGEGIRGRAQKKRPLG